MGRGRGNLRSRSRASLPCHRFANDGETLFEAVQSTVIDFDGRTRECSTGCDLSRFIDEESGVFDTRDDLFARIGSFEDTWRGKAFEWLYAGRSSA